MCMMADTGAGTGGGEPASTDTGAGTAPETIATTLTVAGDAPVENLSTTQDITEETEEAAQAVACDGCAIHDVQFVTRAGVTTLRCKICDAEVEPADAGEAQSLADYNK
jgi:uncharacterized membrane protein